MQTSALNLRFELWDRGVPRPQWSTEVTRVVGCSMDRAMALLTHAEPDLEERKKLVGHFGLDEQTFIFAPPAFAAEWVLGNNIAYLLDNLEHGGRKKLAQHLGVDPSTVSAWGKKRRAPHRSNLEALRHFFGIPAGTDLEHELLFLLDVPLTVAQRRRWLKERVDVLDPDTLKDLFPALERLLSS